MRRAHGGYILVETIVAMGLLSISMIVIQGAVRQAILARGQAQDFTTARFLMEQKLAELEMQPEVREGQEEATFPEPYERFSYQWSLTKIDVPLPEGVVAPGPNDGAALRDLRSYVGRYTLTISWSRAGQPFSVKGETLFGPTKLWMPQL